MGEKCCKSLVTYRLLSPGSEWRLHRQWFEHSAMADLLGVDDRLAQKRHALSLPRRAARAQGGALRPSRAALERSLRREVRRAALRPDQHLFRDRRADVPEGTKRRFGYSRDKRSDCVQVVIALVVTPEGLPLAYEMLPGNTADNTTLRGMLDEIEKQYGKARAHLGDGPRHSHRGGAGRDAQQRAAGAYSVGTPKGRLTKLEKALARKTLAGSARGRARQTAGRGGRESMCWPRAARASTRNAPCAGAS